MKEKYKCLDCEHFEFWHGSPHYSEATPGDPMELTCEKGNWDANDADSEDELSSFLDKGSECDQFEQRKKE